MIEKPKGLNSYILGIGSNIEPFKNVPGILDRLLDHFHQILISRILKTEAIGMLQDANPFLNFCIYVETDLKKEHLKNFCNSIEMALGRDRTDNLKKVKNRTADLDILLTLPYPERVISQSELPVEKYLLPTTLELLQALQFSGLPTFSPLDEGQEIVYKKKLIGKKPLFLKKEVF